MPNVTLVDNNNASLIFATTAGGFQMPTTPQAAVLLNDQFNGATIDTTYRWQSPVLAGTATMTQSNGSLITTLGTTASNGASITSIEMFEPSIGALSAGTLVSIEAAPALNTSRCFGFYTKPGSFTAATPVQDGYVWEFDITGTFGASIYNAGTRVSRTLFALNGATFITLLISYQGLNVNFFLNNFQTPVLSVPVIQPSTLNLPFGFHSINHTTPPVGAPTWNMSAVAVLDSSGAIQSGWNGQNYSRNRVPAVYKALNGVVVTSETTIWTPATGRKFRLMGGNLTGGVAAGNVVLKDNTAGASLPIVLPFGAVGQNIPFIVGGNGYISTTANNVLTATGASTQTLSGWVYGTEE